MSIPVISGIFKIINTIAGIGADYFQDKRDTAKETRQFKHDLAKAKVQAQIDILKSAQEHEQSWEIIALRMTERSYKDEYALGLISIPMIMSFWPGGAPYVNAGFAALDATPIWYQALVMAAFSLALGVRLQANFAENKAVKGLIKRG